MTTPTETSVLRQKFGLQKKSSSLRMSSRTLGAFKEAFSAIDKKGVGKIDQTELEVVLSKLGQKPTEEELQSILSLDPVNNGELSFATFAQIMGQRMPIEQQTDELMEVFKVFDKDADGCVALADIKEVLADVYGESFDDFEELVGLDVDRIDFDTFKKMMLGEF
eukprot:TRINITY_DN3583_c0_g1_i1.p1 TRINITY_DN3583_c0_g1~~TRINITY_DN3583_c0_g1_i1.p1  ORF type:complete len:165 (+),score=32.89 TRINITY_DN3583_c0_g1_i1:179-673(+)